MSSTFKTVGWEVSQLIGSVENGAIQLPDLQRPFVWPKTKVRDLLDSMFRGYPVGELMFWDVAAEGETHTISGAEDRTAAHQIVDGQQRLTSLYAALRGRKVRDEDYRLKDITISFNPGTLKFEVRTPAIAKSPQWIEDISEYFRSPLKVSKAYIKGLEAATGPLSDDDEEAITEVFTRLQAILSYRFDVVHIQKEVDKRTVADIFVRINSEGVNLKAYDYILTWLSVFWPGGREELEDFARNSRVTPERATEIEGRPVAWTPKNHYINLETGHLVRALVAIGQSRAKLSDSYNALQAKDRTTGVVDSERQDLELDMLKRALPVILKPLHWDEFVRCLPQAGFRSRKGITSATNLISSYVVWLLGRIKYNVDLDQLRVLVARWFFMSQLTSRYTGSGESQLQKDLDRFSGLERGDAAGFTRLANDVISTELTADFWDYRMPDSLITSGPALSPAYQCYLAALNVLDADMFMLNMQVRSWMDPTLTPVKGLEGHHIFPRKYQENVLGTTDTKRINQAANFAPTDWDTNILISDRAPSEYWPGLVTKRGNDTAWLAQQHYWHALPEGWENMEYDDFLLKRRKLMAQVTRDAFTKLSSGTSIPLAPATSGGNDLSQEPLTIDALVESGILRIGDVLVPIDADRGIEGVVTEDLTLMIDNLHEFDSLNEATRWLGVDNVDGLDYWSNAESRHVSLSETDRSLVTS